MSKSLSDPENPAISNGLLNELVKVFGLDGKRVVSLTLELRWNQFAKLTIERAPLNSEVQEIIRKGLRWQSAQGSHDR